MRVAMLSWEYPPRIVGGISPHVYDLSKQLAAKGVEVHVITKETPLAPDEVVEPSGVRVHRVHLEEKPNDFLHEISLLNDATEVRARQLLEEWRSGGEPTIFHAHDWLSLDAAQTLKYEYALPMLATVHATEEGRHQGIHNDTSRYIHDQEYWLTYEAWRVIVCSEFMKSEIVRTLDVPQDKVDVIYNGVDPSKFRFEWTAEERQIRRRTLAADDENLILYVGRFVREKGIQVLLNAANVILARHPKTKFVIVGGGHRERFERFVHWSHLSEHIVFTGFKSGRPLHEMYRCADMAVFPSLYEPFGIVALEAMAAGVPVVSSDAGGLREVVLHDETGTLSYASNPESLAWAICRVLEDPARAAKLRNAANVRLDTDFDWGYLADQTIAVYERIWNEFRGSYWADRTLWPFSPGAEERAAQMGATEKALTAHPHRERPLAAVGGGVPVEFEHEEVESERED